MSRYELRLQPLARLWSAGRYGGGVVLLTSAAFMANDCWLVVSGVGAVSLLWAVVHTLFCKLALALDKRLDVIEGRLERESSVIHPSEGDATPLREVTRERHPCIAGDPVDADADLGVARSRQVSA